MVIGGEIKAGDDVNFHNDDSGSHQNCFWEKVGHLAQPAEPPPPKEGGPKKKTKGLMFILHFRLF